MNVPLLFVRLGGSPASTAWRSSSELPSRAASNIRLAKLMVSAGRLLASGACDASFKSGVGATLDISFAFGVALRLYRYT
jgi:hypothetical protein